MQKLLPYVFLLFILISCKDEDDNIPPRNNDFEIEDFIWQGLNTYYYWQSSVADLADKRFDSQNPMPAIYRSLMKIMSCCLNRSFPTRIALAGS